MNEQSTKLRQIMGIMQANDGEIVNSKQMAEVALSLIQSLEPRQFELLRTLLRTAEATHDVE